MTGDRGIVGHTARPGNCHIINSVASFHQPPAGHHALTFTTAADLLETWKKNLCVKCDMYFTARCSLGRSPKVHPDGGSPACSLFHGIGMPWTVGE